LEALDTAELAELFAYHSLLLDEEQEQRDQRKLDQFVKAIGEAPRG
jgi:hypothetical protein